MIYDDFLEKNRRLSTLRLLKDTGGAANDSVIQMTLERFGYRLLSRDAVRDDLRFLQVAELVKLEEITDTVMVATITRKGVEVAEGRQVVDGVQRPSIGV